MVEMNTVKKQKKIENALWQNVASDIAKKYPSYDGIFDTGMTIRTDSGCHIEITRSYRKLHPNGNLFYARVLGDTSLYSGDLGLKTNTVDECFKTLEILEEMYNKQNKVKHA